MALNFENQISGSSIIATSETRTNVAYGTMPTPDQVPGLVLPSNGLIEVLYQATWQESTPGVGRAALFIGGNQLKIASGAITVQETGIGNFGVTNVALSTTSLGLVSTDPNSPYGGDVTTGQILGNAGPATTTGSPAAALAVGGGPCYIFAAAGTYTVSVQFKASSGNVTASSRRLYVRVFTF